MEVPYLNLRERRKATSIPPHVDHTKSSPNISITSVSPAILVQPPLVTTSAPPTFRKAEETKSTPKGLTVTSWIKLLRLSPNLQAKYINLFEEEEIFSIEQVVALTEKHLHWMGVKVGTILLMVEAINRLRLPSTKKEDTSPSNLYTIPSTENSPRDESKASSTSSSPTSAPQSDCIIITDEKNTQSDTHDNPLPSTLRFHHSHNAGLSLTVPAFPKSITSPDLNGYEHGNGGDSSPRSVSSLKIHQVGGHFGVIARSKPGFVGKSTDTAEANFYQQLQETKKIPDSFKRFFPKLDQIIEIPPTLLGPRKQVVMEDLTYGYAVPCIMDVKMGTKTYAEDTNPIKKKLRQMKDENTTSSKFGIRITGFRTYNVTTSQFHEISKDAAEKIASIELLDQNLYAFFNNGTSLRIDVVKFFIEQLTILLSWMETQAAYRFYSSSLFFVYDGGIMDTVKADVRMIDFAHVSEIKDGRTDEGYTKGLRKLIECFKKLLSQTN